jgi:hypothetical protein
MADRPTDVAPAGILPADLMGSSAVPALLTVAYGDFYFSSGHPCSWRFS